MQFINIEMVDIDAEGADIDGFLCPLVSIPRVGETVVVKDTGDMEEYISFKVTDVVYHSLFASSSPRRAYVTLFVEKNSGGAS